MGSDKLKYIYFISNVLLCNSFSWKGLTFYQEDMNNLTTIYRKNVLRNIWYFIFSAQCQANDLVTTLLDLSAK